MLTKNYNGYTGNNKEGLEFFTLFSKTNYNNLNIISYRITSKRIFLKTNGLGVDFDINSFNIFLRKLSPDAKHKYMIFLIEISIVITDLLVQSHNKNNKEVKTLRTEIGFLKKDIKNLQLKNGEVLNFLKEKKK